MAGRCPPPLALIGRCAVPAVHCALMAPCHGYAWLCRGSERRSRSHPTQEVAAAARTNPRDVAGPYRGRTPRTPRQPSRVHTPRALIRGAQRPAVILVTPSDAWRRHGPDFNAFRLLIALNYSRQTAAAARLKLVPAAAELLR